MISLILSWIAVTNSKSVMLEEVEKELLYASEKYANQFSSELQTQENVVDLICTMVVNDFVVEEYADNREKFLTREKKLNNMIKYTMGNIPETSSLYFTFNPETSGENDEIWYIRNENGEVFHMVADNTVEDWLVDGTEDNEYYFQSIKNGKMWSGVEYDSYLDIFSVTYSRSCWDENGQLIGVMGADIFIDDIFDTVKNIQLNEGGYAFLMDKDYNYLAGSKAKKFFNYMKNDGLINLKLEKGYSNRPVYLSYSSVSGERYITTYASTSNGWVLALIQSEDSMLLPIKYTNQMLLSMAIFIVIGAAAYAIFFSKKSVIPIVKEYEQKDIILLHQSRQAKLGEMVGNIAHQWKQPLNVMSITLSNLWDDFNNARLTEKQLKEHIEDMRLYIKNMSNTVDDFADFLKPARNKQGFSINKEINSALSLMAESIKINRISVIVESEEELNVCGFGNEFCQGIFNILNNARDAIIEAKPEIQEIKINIYKNKNDKQKHYAVVDIINNGNKIAEEAKPLLFKPYYTTKEEKGGTGLGLYLTRQIIEVHMNGTVELFNVDNSVCCRIVIPMEA
jgi:signal transduction histidine kinase